MKLHIHYLLACILLFGTAAKIEAQNTGPVAPEAMSFEPIDATDMVNLLSGDFSYVLPLIHVPGPGGGFSMPISYHGGVTMDQEASWVGLGWSLNPGAINRTVNGFADDVLACPSIILRKEQTKKYVYHRLDMGAGYENLFSAGTTYSWGDYKAFGGHVGLKYGEGRIGANFNYSFTDNKFDIGGSATMNNTGINASTSGVGVSIGLMHVNYGKNGLLYSLSFGNKSSGVSSLGLSFSSDGVGVSIAGVGMGNIVGNAGSLNDIRKFDSQLHVALYTPWFYISYKRNKIYYKFYKRDEYETNGLLYTVNSYSKGEIFQHRKKLLDVYTIEDHYFNKTFRQNENNFLAFDNYSVTAQGLLGKMSPKVQQGALIANQSMRLKYDGNDLIESLNYKINIGEEYQMKDRLYFSFDNMFDADTRVKFDENLAVDNTIPNNYFKKSFSDNSLPNRRGGKNFIQYFTNKQILQEFELMKSKGFIDTDNIDRSKKFTETISEDDDIVIALNGGQIPILHRSTEQRKKLDLGGIGAFSVTSSDGKTYHYSLPVYQFESIQRNNLLEKNGFEEYQNLGMYASSWLLTGITGPDFIDDGNGLLDKNDKGYWVKFDYGKFTDGYVWACPYDFKSYGSCNEAINWGRKQIYYLNSISTSTHTAYFVKDIRKDGRGKSFSYQIDDKYGKSQKVCIGGTYVIVTPSSRLNYNIKEEAKVMYLDKIVLVNNADSIIDYNSLTGSQEESCISSRSFFSSSLLKQNYLSKFKVSNSGKIIDSKDFLNYDFNKAIQIIDFNYDYSLCPNTPNSTSDKKGKLTLTAIHVKGKGGTNIQPPYMFEYYNYGSFSKDNKDIWGYYDNDPKAWSLKKITTPLGGQINVKYEEDEYSREVVRDEMIKYPVVGYYCGLDKVEKGDPFYGEANLMIKTVGVSFDKQFKLNDIFKVGEFYNIKLDFKVSIPCGVGLNGGNSTVGYSAIGQKRLIEINGNSLTFEVNDCFWDCPSREEGNVRDEYVVEDCCIDSYFTTYKLEDAYVEGKNLYYKGKGGGIRVNELQLSDEAGRVYKTKYDYNIPGTNTTSGVTIYAPVEDENKYSKYIPFKSELPMPGVIYEYVTVEDCGETEESDVKSIYQFEVYDQVQKDSKSFKIGEQFQFADVVGSYYNNDRRSLLKSNFATIGRLKSKSLYNQAGDLLSKTTNTYKSLDEIDYGLSQETFVSDKIYKIKRSGTWNEEEFINTTSKITYPSVLEKVTTQQDGFTSEMINLEWDKGTGAVTKSKSIAANGDVYISEVIPAHTKYPEMGSKILNFNHKNMLSQEAATYQYKTIGIKDKLIGGSVQTWSKDWLYRDQLSTGAYVNKSMPVWRKHKNFVLTGDVGSDGVLTNAQKYNWSATEAQNITNGWKKKNEITQYNEYSAPLESKDINGNYVATKYDPSGLYVVASVANSKWEDFAATSFEFVNTVGSYWSTSSKINLLKSGTTILTSSSLKSSQRNGLSAIAEIDAHSGKQYIRFYGAKTLQLSNIIASNGTERSFVLSCWIHKNSSASTKFKVKYSHGTHLGNRVYEKSGAEKIQFGDWILMKYEFELPKFHAVLEQIQIVVNSSSDVVYLDDFRIQPLTAAMNSYSYDNHSGDLLAILNANNIATKYYYDSAGRLVKIEKETPSGFEKVREYEYKFARSIED
jgi:YD repeat-containing protein